jgi:cytosine/adenosine deaminase-related metal-dependent hydrolase
MKFHAVELLNKHNLLGSDTTYIHCNTLSDQEMQLVADTGGTASIAPEVEMHMGHGFPATGRLLAHGIRPSLSIDVVTAIGGDMFGVMRATLAMERALVNDRALQQGRVVDRLDLTTRDVLEFATIEGARACGLADKIGSLTPGKEADIIMLKTDRPNLMPLNNPIGATVLAANPANVDTVLVAGTPVKRNGQFTSLDLTRVYKLAEESRDFLLEQVGLRPGFDWPLNTPDAWKP